MAQLATQAGVQAGTLLAFTAAAVGGDSFQPGDDVSVYLKNPTGGALTVTIVSQQLCNQGVQHNLVVAIPAASERVIGPIPASRFADANGLAQMTYSAVGFTVAVLRP
jgi:hypothetical protein